MRERDQRILQSAKLIIAFCAGAFAVFVWGVNAHDEALSLAAFHGAIDIMMFALGARGAVMVSDSVEAVLTNNKSTSTENVNVKRDPKDFDVPLDELNAPGNVVPFPPPEPLNV